MFSSIFLLLALLKYCYCEQCLSDVCRFYENVNDCGECEENNCKLKCIEIFSRNNDYCYWNYQSNRCVRSGGKISIF